VESGAAGALGRGRHVAVAQLIPDRLGTAGRDRCRLDVAPYVHRALAFLRRELGAAVPAEVVNRLERARVSAAVEAEFAREAGAFQPAHVVAGPAELYAAGAVRWAAHPCC